MVALLNYFTTNANESPTQRLMATPTNFARYLVINYLSNRMKKSVKVVKDMMRNGSIVKLFHNEC